MPRRKEADISPTLPAPAMEGVKRFLRSWLGIEWFESPGNDAVLRFGLGIALLAVVLRFFFWAYTGRTWEDALITVLHSENLMNGLGLTHYLGKGEPPLHGFTSPLSVLIPLIGDLFKVGFGLSFIKIVSAVTGGLTVLYAMAIAVHAKIKLPAPLAVMVMGYLAVEHQQILWGMAGMETQMATLALVMSIYFTIAEKPALLGACLGLCMLARPDSAFWCAIVGLYLLIFYPRRLPVTIAVAMAVYLPWVAFATLYYGSPVPNTIVAKNLGYLLWTGAPQLKQTLSLYMQVIWVSVSGSYTRRAVFQALGPTFAGHGTGFQAVINDGGIICDFMVVMMLAGIASVLRRRQWAYLPMILFVLAYLVYYVFFVAIVFGWYLGPFAAACIFLSARGIQATTGLFRAARPRAVAMTVFAALYLSCIAGVLPYTFTTEKVIQNQVEDGVRKQVGLFLNHVMGPEDTVSSEALGYIGYYSRRIVYDWPGLCSRKVVEYSRTHPRTERSLPYMTRALQPDFAVMRFIEFKAVMNEPWLMETYRPIASFEVPGGRNNPLSKSANVDLGFFVFAKKTWHPGATEFNGEPIGINPRNVNALKLLELQMLNAGKLQEARNLLEQGVTARPDVIELHHHLSIILFKLRDYDGAIEESRKALAIEPTSSADYSNLGLAYLAKGDQQQAISNLREALRYNPGHVESLTTLAKLYLSQGNYAEAKKTLEALLKADPDNNVARSGLKMVAEFEKRR